MSRPWVLITPASRGIGFHLTRHLLAHTPPSLPLVATCRRAEEVEALRRRLLEPCSSTPSSSPANEKRLTVLPLDVTKEPIIAAAAASACQLFPPPEKAKEGQQAYHLRLAFALPGILPPQVERRAWGVDEAQARAVFLINALGPLLLMKWFGKFLPRKVSPPLLDAAAGGEEEGVAGGGEEEEGAGGKRFITLPPYAVWLAMSARVGSTSDNRTGGWHSYRASKSAVNSLVRTFDHELAARCGREADSRAMALAYHPGTVRTDLSRDYWKSAEAGGKLFEPEDAVQKMIDVITTKVGLEGRGRCWDWKGEEILP